MRRQPFTAKRVLAPLAVSVVLATTGVASTLTTSVAQAAGDPAPESPSASAMRQAKATGEHVEDVSQRTDTSQVFANPDGSWTLDAAPEPVRVQDDSGNWHAIDTTLVRTDDGFAPRYAPSNLTISDGGVGDFAQVSDGDHTIGFSWNGALPAPEIDGSTATYKNVAPGEDLVVEATDTGFEHSLVLNERPRDAVDFTTGVDIDGAKVSETAGGGAVIKADDGDVVATIPQPAVYDASGDDPATAKANASDAQVSGTPASGQDLTVTASKTFLQNPGTQYPVTIDPVVQIFTYGDTWIQNTGITASQGTNPELYVGTHDGGTHVDRAYMQFVPSDSWTWSDKVVNSADLVLDNDYSYTCTASQINASRITQSWDYGLSWPGPFAGADSAGFSPAYGGPDASCSANGYTHWDVTNIVNSWANGSPNYGIRLMAQNESSNNSFRHYYSANHPNTPTSLPHININYNSYPATPANISFSPQAGSVIGSTTPTISADVADADGGTVALKAKVISGSTSTTYTGTAVTSGSRASVVIPSGVLSNGNAYTVQVSATDGSLSSGLGAPDLGYVPIPITVNTSATMDPPPPPGQISAPMATTYGIDEYELSDMTDAAQDDGTTLQQAIDAYAWQDDFAEAAQELYELSPSTYAQADVQDPTTGDPTVTFTSSVPAGASAIVAGLPVAVDLDAGAVYSEDKATEIAGETADAALADAPSGSSVVADADPVTGAITAQIYSPSTPMSPTASQIGVYAKASVQSQNPTVSIPGVDVSTATQPPVEDDFSDTAVGGEHTNVGNGDCTMGFTAVSSSGKQGFLEARHCDPVSNFEDVNGHVWYDADWPDVVKLDLNYGDMSFTPLNSPATALDIFQANRNEYRFNGKVLKPALHMRVCFYGQYTNGWRPGTHKSTCDTVWKLRSGAFAYPGGRTVRNLVLLTHQYSGHGDSGGPVFVNNRPVGVISGQQQINGGPFHTSFTQLYGNLGRLNVSVLH